jgi:sugar/nucleoside kinase (ribokinase family)
MKKILGIGSALVDVVTMVDNESVLDRFALPKGSMQLVDGEKSNLIKSGTTSCKKTFAPGGSAANTIHGIAMLGGETGFIGSIGKDETGDIFENDFRNAGVKTMLLRRNTPTGTSVSLVTPDTERTMATHLGAATELTATDMKKADFEGFDILYMEGYLIIKKDLVLKACSIAKELGMKIALDLSSFNVVEDNPGAFREVIEEYVDILFANAEEAKAFTGMEAETALYRLSELCETAVVKVGAEGSWIKRGEEVVRIGTLPVKPVDTTGAGDQYASGFLYGIANDESLENCGLYGAILSGKVIETSGARITGDKWKEIKKLIKEIRKQED